MLVKTLLEKESLKCPREDLNSGFKLSAAKSHKLLYNLKSLRKLASFMVNYKYPLDDEGICR